MVLFRRYRPSATYVILFFILLLICIFVTSNGTYSNFKSLSIFSDKTSQTFISNGRGTNASDGYFKVHLDLTTTEAACRVDDRLLVYILSTAINIERRAKIRSTWASLTDGICFVFFLGQIPGTTPNAGALQTQISREKRQFKDTVQIDHFESYANVVYKEVAALQWSNRFYPSIPFLFKTDDDLLVDSMILSSIIQTLTKSSEKVDPYLKRHRPAMIPDLEKAEHTTFFRGGWAMDYQPTIRGGGKFSVSEKVWPHKVLPAYCSGFGWIMSKTVRDRLVIASHNYLLNMTAWIGDVFASGFLAKAASVKCTGIHIDFEQTGSGKCACSMIKNPMLTVCSSSFHAGGSGTNEEKLAEYDTAWRIIKERHTLPNVTIVTLPNCIV